MSAINVSFDLWGTVIRANPEYKTFKNELIRTFSKTPDEFTDDVINSEIKKIKKFHDGIIELYGTQPDIRHLFAEMAFKFNIDIKHVSEFYDKYQTGFLQYPPLFYSDETNVVLGDIFREHHTVYASTNTLFTDARVMKIFINRLDRFMYANISHEKGVSKPHKDMFFADSTIHVGDNIRTDGASVNYGIPFYQINSNEKTIINLYDHLSVLQRNK